MLSALYGESGLRDQRDGSVGDGEKILTQIVRFYSATQYCGFNIADGHN